MSQPSISQEERYAILVAEFLSNPDVTPPANEPQSKKRFGWSALKINNKIFAMLVKGRLVIKLPQQRVDALTASGVGERYDPGRGRQMKEWLTVEPMSEEQWLPLAREAMEFVASKH